MAKRAPARPGSTVPSEDGWLRPGSLPLMVLRLVWRNPVRVAGGALLVTLTAACLWNPLMGQRGKHPAPLFGPKSVASPVERHAEVTPLPDASAAMPRPSPRPDPVTVASILAETAHAPDATALGRQLRETPKPPPVVRTDKAEPAKENGRDAVKDGGKADGTRVAAAQRALTRLGYGPLQPDGLMGPGTRAAIERFEKDRKVPVTGAIAGRTAKLLGVQDS